MSFPHAVGPQIPSAPMPQIDVHAPELPPGAAMQLGCMGCGPQLPQLGEVVKPPMPLWLKIFGVMIFAGCVFGLLAFTSRNNPRYPERP